MMPLFLGKQKVSPVLFRTLLTMFEVLFANWAPACRVLIDNVRCRDWLTMSELTNPYTLNGQG